MTVDEIYELVAMNIYNSIGTDEWEKAVLNIHGDDTTMNITGFYIANGENHNLAVNKFDMDVEFALMELHEITTENDSNQWNKADFTLLPDGSFDIEFDYDPSLD